MVHATTRYARSCTPLRRFLITKTCPTPPRGARNHSLCSQLHTTSSIFDHESKLSDQKSPRGAPETIRTSDTRFRRAVLYPLSYEGLCMHNA